MRPHLLLPSLALLLTQTGLAADLYVSPTGDDVNDCTDMAAPCATVAKAASMGIAGDTIHLEAGNYSATSSSAFPIDFTGKTISGSGSATTSISPVSSASTYFVASGSPEPSTISGLAFTAPVPPLSSSTAQGVAIFTIGTSSTNDVLISDVAINDAYTAVWGTYSYGNTTFYADDLEINGGSYGVWVYTNDEALDFTLTNSTITGNNQSVYVEVARSIETLGTLAHDIDISSNTIANNGSSSALQVYVYDGATAHVNGNTITGAAGGGISVQADASSSTSASIPTLMLDVMNNTISDVENQAIGANIYENFDVNAVISNNAITNGGEDGVYFYASSSNSTDLEISNNIITNIIAGNGVSLEFYNAEDESKTISVTDNTIDAVSRDGIYAYLNASTYSGDFSDPSIQFDISNNTISNAGDDGIEASISDYVVAHGTISDNTITDPDASGIYVYVDDSNMIDLSIENNSVTDAGDNGIYMSAYAYNTIDIALDNNTISGGDNGGVQLYVSDYSNTIRASLTDNTITGSAGEGVSAGITDSYYNAFHLEMTGNTVTGHDGHGVELLNTYSSSNNLSVEVNNNVISDNGGDGINIYNSYGAFNGDFNGNTITGNVEDGVHVEYTDDVGFYLDLTHNTIKNNSDGYTATTTSTISSGTVITVPNGYDFNNNGNSYYTVWADENWWGTNDTGAIRSHIENEGKNATQGKVFWTDLNVALDFTVDPAEGSEFGGTWVTILSEPGTAFVPYAGDVDIIVTFDGVDAQLINVASDGLSLDALTPAGMMGDVDITVTNPGGQTGTLTGAYSYTYDLTDGDEDGIGDTVDNCPDDQNTTQDNLDGDSMGDVCDDDDDDDTVTDDMDNCPFDANTDQLDTDSDDEGDVCDDDDDDDGVDDTGDNCPLVDNDQTDTDMDGMGDACDDDDDGDGVVDDDDNCPLTANTDQADNDSNIPTTTAEELIFADADAIVYYPFDGNADDALGTGFNGVTSGGGATLTADRDGNPDSAYEFDGASTMRFGDIPLGAGSFSVSYWLKTDPNQPTNIHERHLSKRAVCTYANFFDFQYYNTGGGLGTAGHETRANATGQGGISANATDLTNGEWTHIVHVVDADTGTSTAYADGVEASTNNFSASAVPSLTMENSADFGVSISPCLGTTSTIQMYNGALDDIAVFQRALSAAEVATLAAPAPTGNNTDPVDGDVCDDDDDNDLVLDVDDNCPTDANTDQLDTDSDNIGDVCDDDDDNDLVLDVNDNCPLDANNDQLDTDGDDIGDVCDDDDDGDGTADADDTCPGVDDDQTDTDGDEIGDACDDDDDNDTINDGDDNCPLTANTDQLDTDSDNAGDACDDDDDGDTVADGDDNCPLTANTDQLDTDSDDDGDACDDDDDDDTVADASDNCPLIANLDQTDTDMDGMGDACDDDDDDDGVADGDDNCPLTANTDQLDTDSDEAGDACDDDDDGDTYTDGSDNCPLLANDQTDTDMDGMGDDCDDDDDNDGVLDGTDNCPLDANADQINTDMAADGGDACDDDDDNDTIADASDNCVTVANTDQLDLDSDEAGDACDDDDDDDSVNDVDDNCPMDPNTDQADADSDGWGDVCDETITIPDADADGVLDDVDNCPDTANTAQIDLDKDGIGDDCDDNIDIVVDVPNDDDDGKGQGCNTSAGPMSFAWVVALLALALRRRQDLEPVVHMAKL